MVEAGCRSSQLLLFGILLDKRKGRGEKTPPMVVVIVGRQ